MRSEPSVKLHWTEEVIQQQRGYQPNQQLYENTQQQYQYQPSHQLHENASQQQSPPWNVLHINAQSQTTSHHVYITNTPTIVEGVGPNFELETLPRTSIITPPPSYEESMGEEQNEYHHQQQQQQQQQQKKKQKQQQQQKKNKKKNNNKVKYYKW